MVAGDRLAEFLNPESKGIVVEVEELQPLLDTYTVLVNYPVGLADKKDRWPEIAGYENGMLELVNDTDMVGIGWDYWYFPDPDLKFRCGVQYLPMRRQDIDPEKVT